MNNDFQIPSEVVPHNGFFDLIIVNMPTGLDSKDKCELFLSNYRKYPFITI